MGFWDNVKDGFASGRRGKGPNYVKKERERQAREFQGLMAVAIRRAYQENRTRRGRGREEIQYQDGMFTVKVRSDYNRDHDCDATNILIFPRENNPRGSHQHVIISEDGRELLNEWRER